jgi:hypothetical protein
LYHQQTYLVLDAIGIKHLHREDFQLADNVSPIKPLTAPYWTVPCGKQFCLLLVHRTCVSRLPRRNRSIARTIAHIQILACPSSQSARSVRSPQFSPHTDCRTCKWSNVNLRHGNERIREIDRRAGILWLVEKG